ncbi:MAG: M16 family metallopeptidase [Sphingobacteriaceae bacterium]
MDHHLLSLPNGIRVLLKPGLGEVAHACVLVHSGSRDEGEGKDGLAHLIEHLLFKRTERRSTRQILNRMEVVGGDLNAYTTKEYTCIHASFLRPHLERALDLVEDVLFHSTFPQEELEKEKGVILDEIASYLDQPEEAIQDDFEELIFANHPLGRNILGNPDSVAALQQKDIREYLAKNYRTNELVIGIIGNFELKKVEALVNKIFGNIPANSSANQRTKPLVNPATNKRLAKPINQSHVLLGSQAYSAHSSKREALLLLNNLLGGMGMSSRLNLEIREKHGIAYTIESSYIPLSDTGLFTIYLGTDTEKVDKALKLVDKELKKLRDNTIGSLALQQAKQKFMGQIALAEEGRLSLLISLCKSVLDYGMADSLPEVFAKIERIEASQLLEIANEIFEPSRLSSLIFEPQEF